MSRIKPMNKALLKGKVSDKTRLSAMPKFQRKKKDEPEGTIRGTFKMEDLVKKVVNKRDEDLGIF